MACRLSSSAGKDKVDAKAAEKAEEKEGKSLLRGAAAERVLKALQRVEEKRRKRAQRKAEARFQTQSHSNPSLHSNSSLF